MAKLVALPTPPEIVLQCRDCGCQTFYMYPDGRSECAHCECRDETEKHRVWRKHAPGVPKDIRPEKGEPPSMHVICGHPTMGRDVVLERAMRDDVISVVVFAKTQTHSWHAKRKGLKWWKNRLNNYLDGRKSEA